MPFKKNKTKRCLQEHFKINFIAMENGEEGKDSAYGTEVLELKSLKYEPNNFQAPMLEGQVLLLWTTVNTCQFCLSDMEKFTSVFAILPCPCYREYLQCWKHWTRHACQAQLWIGGGSSAALLWGRTGMCCAIGNSLVGRGSSCPAAVPLYRVQPTFLCCLVLIYGPVWRERRAMFSLQCCMPWKSSNRVTPLNAVSNCAGFSQAMQGWRKGLWVCSFPHSSPHCVLT